MMNVPRSTTISAEITQSCCWCGISSFLEKADYSIRYGASWLGRNVTLLLRNVIEPIARVIFNEIGLIFKFVGEFLISPVGVGSMLFGICTGMGATLLTLANSSQFENQKVTKIVLNILASVTFVIGGAAIASGTMLTFAV